MGRFLSLILFLIVAVSHGPMGMEAMHADGSTHDYAVFDLHADHHHDHDSDSALSKIMPQDRDSGSMPADAAHHVHVASALAPMSDFTVPARPACGTHNPPTDDARLASLPLAPLPEPPSA